jgi:hypothetical protein
VDFPRNGGMIAASEENTMSRRPRRNHSPAFKAKVAVEAIKGEKTLIELSQAYDVHPNQVIPAHFLRRTPSAGLALSRSKSISAAGVSPNSV